jgi:hypothetical protein
MLGDKIIDWDIFREACLALLSGHNPYLVGQGQMQFFNPVWTLIPLIPLALLPSFAGYILNALTSMAVMLGVTKRLKMTAWEFFFVAISPMHLQSMIYGNIEWIPLLGILMPAPLALVFFATKPQATIGLILLLLFNQWTEGGWKKLIITLAPTILVIGISFVLWGMPPIPGVNNPGQRSLFPWSLLAGIPALVLAIRNRDQRMAAFVGPFVSPYVTFHGYLPALFPFKGKWMALAVAISFIPVLLGIVA